jgi:hypothetical protein
MNMLLTNDMQITKFLDVPLRQSRIIRAIDRSTKLRRGVSNDQPHEKRSSVTDRNIQKSFLKARNGKNSWTEVCGRR